ncbi:exosortase J [Granulicella cerasi]|nr:exosortase J [Granulicella cerasi]
MAGLFTIYPTARQLLLLWGNDDLKSMGAVVPLISMALILRVWRRLGWETEGSWWGFAMLAVTVALVYIQSQTLFVVMVNKHWLVQLPPFPVVAIAYTASMVLLFGGWRLLREAWFPVLFMGAVIPIPQSFTNLVDLPLQHASATVARGFAHLLGEQLTQDRLRLMFTPEYGMFIAPGCNGIRGAITLGMAALVVGYLYRFRWWVFAPVVAGAVLLGYLFNFLRLCLLVVYYKLTLQLPWFQVRAKQGDYVIGGVLFVCALLIFFALANKLRRDPADTLPPIADQPVRRPTHARAYLARVAVVLVLAAIFAGDTVHVIRAEKLNTMQVDAAPLPDQLGNWHKVRQWDDRLVTGWIVYTWAEYQSPDLAQKVALGVSPRLSQHDAEICHLARGEDPTWHGHRDIPTPQGVVAVSEAMYNNGALQWLEAASVCQNGRCEQYSGENQHVTMVVAPPEGRLPMQSSRGPVPVLLRVETTDSMTPVEQMRPRLDAALTAFLGQAKLGDTAMPYGHRQ